MAETWHVGDVWNAEATITAPGEDTPVDPTSITATFVNPNSKVTAATVTRIEKGKYVASIKLTTPGNWQCNFQAAGNYEASEPESIKVFPRYG